MKKMPKCNPLVHGNPLIPLSRTPRRSPRFLSQENPRKIDHKKTPNSSRSEVTTLSQSPPTPTDSTDTVSYLKSKRTRKSVKLMNGSAKRAGLNGVLRRSQRIANLQSTPASADARTPVEISAVSDFSMKYGSFDVSQQGEGLKGRRVSVRLIGLAKGAKQSSAILGELGRLEVAGKREYRKEHSSVKGANDSCVLRKCSFSDVTRTEDSHQQRRRSARLMGSDKSSESLIGNFEKTVGSELIQRRCTPKRRQNSGGRNGSGKGLNELSDFLERQFSVVSSEKGNCEKRQRSVRLVDSASGVEKLETAVHVREEFRSKMKRKVKKEDSVNSIVVMPMEAGTKRRKIEGEDVRIFEKRSNLCNEACNFQGWTKDQEAALQRAYFAVKPSPHFWKKVSKMVPGKSAQECYDKVHSNLETPSPRPRWRRNKKWSPLGHFKLSAGKLLESSESNRKKLRNRKDKNLLAQKTVRHLLQKHLLVDQGYEVDLFSVLETTSSKALPQMKTPITPDCILKPHSKERPSLTVKSTMSKFDSPCPADFTSPPVLKQVKNMALHEKYIDQLHTRDARRKKISSACAMNCANADSVTRDIRVKNMNIKAARAALVSDAKDAINKFQHLQSIGICDYNDTGDGNDDDDESEEGPC